MSKKILTTAIILAVLAGLGILGYHIGSMWHNKKAIDTEMLDTLDNKYYLNYIHDKDTANVPFAHYPLGFVWQANTIDEWYGSYFEQNEVCRLQYRTVYLRDSVNETGALQIIFDKHKDADRPYIFAVELPNNIFSEHIEVAFLDINGNIVVLNAEKNFNAVGVPLDKEATAENAESANMRFGELLYFNSYTANRAIIVLDNVNEKKNDLFALCMSNSEMLISFEYSSSEKYVISIPLKNFKKQFQILK